MNKKTGKKGWICIFSFYISELLFSNLNEWTGKVNKVCFWDFNKTPLIFTDGSFDISEFNSELNI